MAEREKDGMQAELVSAISHIKVCKAACLRMAESSETKKPDWEILLDVGDLLSEAVGKMNRILGEMMDSRIGEEPQPATKQN